MPKVDPTGMVETVASIPQGQLSERQERIAAGIALMREGKTLRNAASTVGIPRSTLWDYYYGASKLGQDEGSSPRPMRAIVEASYDIAQMAAERIRESLTQRPDDWKPGDLVKAYGVSVDKINAFGQAPSSQGDGVAAILQGILDHADVTISKRSPGREALDVTPEPDETA